MHFVVFLSVVTSFSFIVALVCLNILPSSFKFYAKNAALILWTNMLGVFVAVASLRKPGDPSNMRFWKIFANIFYTHKLFGFDVTVENGEILETDKACIIVANHQEAIDIPASIVMWPSRCTMMAKKSLQYIGTFGLASLLSGVVFVNRRNHKEARRTMDKCVHLLKHDNVKIWIYPEGTRSSLGCNEVAMLPFKKGAFHMAIQAQVPIVPVVFSYYRHQYSTKLRRFDQVNITAKVLTPIQTTGLIADDVNSVVETCRNRMLETYYEISEHLPKAMQRGKLSNTSIVENSDNRQGMTNGSAMDDQDDDKRNYCESG